VSEHHHGLLWAFLEFEEGRDSIGLLLLVLHASYLNSVLERCRPRRSTGGRSDHGNCRGTLWSPGPLCVHVDRLPPGPGRQARPQALPGRNVCGHWRGLVAEFMHACIDRSIYLRRYHRQ
jgi:hypothetical protein